MESAIEFSSDDEKEDSFEILKLQTKIKALYKILEYHNIKPDFIEEDNNKGHFILLNSKPKIINFKSNLLNKELNICTEYPKNNTTDLSLLKIESLIQEIKEITEREFDDGQIMMIIISEIIPILNKIAEHRDTLSFIISDEKFKNYLNSNIEIITKVLSPINKFIESSGYIDFGYYSIPISSYERRLLRYNYLDTIETQEEILSRCRKYQHKNLNDVPFSFPFMRADLLFLTLDEILELLFSNQNLIYIQLNSNKLGKEFSFYILEKMVDDIKYWKMVPHLDEIVTVLSSKLLSLGAELLRLFIYDWRKNLSFSESLYFDWNCIKPNSKKLKELPKRWIQYYQVWKNIYLAQDHFLLGEMLRKKIVKESTYYLSIKDKIASLDDNLSEKYYEYYNNIRNGKSPEEEHPTQVLELIFDDLKDWNYKKSERNYHNRYKE